MTAAELLGLGIVISAPVTLALIVAMVRGYTIDIHMTRQQGKPVWRRRGGRHRH